MMRAVNAHEDVDPRLVAHRPALVYDPQEAYPAGSAAMITDHPGNVLLDDDDAVLARAGDDLSLARLTRDPPGARLDEAPDPLAAARWFAGRPGYGARVYGRVASDGGRTWLQYWIWGYYNPKNLLGLGRHEGDWEMVQVGLAADGAPEVVTCSQHNVGEARAWAEVERFESGDGVHPVIYVAPLSHANYFEPGAHPYLIGIDNPDGTLAPLLAPVEAFGPWVRWRGRWGNSRGIRGGRLGGASPRSPAHKGVSWTAPATYHRLAATKAPMRAFGRLLRRAGAFTWPRLTRLDASRGRGAIDVAWRLGSGALRGATHLHVTVHSGDGAVLADAVQRIRGRAGTAAIMLPATVVEAGQAAFVRGSAYNPLRQRSNPLEARIA